MGKVRTTQWGNITYVQVKHFYVYYSAVFRMSKYELLLPVCNGAGLKDGNVLMATTQFHVTCRVAKYGVGHWDT